jgi:hypothetical protein
VPQEDRQVPSPRQLELSLAAVLAVVLGIFGVMGGLLIMLGGLLFGAQFTGLLAGAGDLVVLAGGGYALAGMGLLAAAWGLWTRQGWARLVAPAAAVLGAALALARFGPGDPVGPLVTATLHIAVLLLVMIPAARESLHPAAPPPDEPPADAALTPVSGTGHGGGPHPA